MVKIDEFVRGYVTCALWSSTGDDEQPLDATYSDSDIAPEAKASMIADCERFIAANLANLIKYGEQRKVSGHEGTVWDYAGHDFWLTRNGHGAGFWDRTDVDETTRDALSDACGWQTSFPEVDIYVGDDGKLYTSPG